MFLYWTAFEFLLLWITCCHMISNAFVTKETTFFSYNHAYPKDAKPVDCEEVLRTGNNVSGEYIIWPRSRSIQCDSIKVYCDMETDRGGWTVLQRRGDFLSAEDFFFKTWKRYKLGFGDLNKDFWLGNDNIFALTNQRKYSVRFDLKTVNGPKRYAVYDAFWIENEELNYRLHIEDYRGDAGDSMTYHNNGSFTTTDKDNDLHPSNCAKKMTGGWWFQKCAKSNLNGLYKKGPYKAGNEVGVIWSTFSGFWNSLEFTEIKIRPKNFK